MVLFQRPPDEKGSVWFSVLIGVFVAFGGLLFGYDTGTINGVITMKYWDEHFSTGYTDAKGKLTISPSQQSLIVSILSAGTFVGALASPLLADRMGRRWGLIISPWIFNAGVMMQVVSFAIPLFVAGRFFAGLGVGLLSTLVPLYQSETAPKWIRGLIVGAYQLAITIGILLAAIVNNGTHKMDDTGSYRIPIALQWLFSVILIIGMHFLPETPRYCIKRGDMTGATRSLAKIRRLLPNNSAIVEEIEEIRANYLHEMSLGNSSYLDCFRKGVNFIFYYGTQFFENSGIKNPFIIRMVPATVNFLSTIPAVLVFDKYGRRPLLLWGGVAMCICHFMVASLGTTTTGQTASGVITVLNVGGQKASIAFVCLFIASFAATWGPLAWVWLFNWATAYSTPYLVNYGPGNANLQSKIFFIWGTACLLCVLFVYFYIFETKGLSLEEVDEMYQTPGLKAKNSSKWRPSIHFRETPLTEIKYHKTTAGSPAEPETAPVAKTTERTEGEAVAHPTAPMAGPPPQTDSVPKTLQTAILRPDEAVVHHHSPLPKPTSLSKLPSPALHSLKSVPSLPTYTDEGTTSSRGPRSIGP
ncbi:Plasma membrane low glucose sensor [Neurospora sp. IMI 360204]|nr:Plasma membrane low glucose sensor [Neurospora sp. IMI 360204]